VQLESVLSDLQEFFVSPILVDPPSARPDSKRWSGELQELQPEAPSSSSTSRSSVVFHAWRGQIVRSKIARPAAHHENAPELSNTDPEDAGAICRESRAFVSVCRSDSGQIESLKRTLSFPPNLILSIGRFIQAAFVTRCAHTRVVSCRREVS